MKNLHLKIFINFLYLSFILLMSCTSGKVDSNETTLINTYWKLTEIDGKQVTVVEGMNEPHLIFAAEQQVTGSTGCNSLFGKYSTSKDKLTFSEISTTKMACTEPEISTVEINLLDVFKNAGGFKLNGKNLELYNNGKLLARFTAKAK